MTYKESMLNPCGGRHIDDLRFVCKKMARLVLLKGIDGRKLKERFPIKGISRKVIEGTVTVRELELWHPVAVEQLKRG